MDDNEQAAKILAEIVHTDVNVCDTCATQHLDQNLNIENLGVWIDPIGKQLRIQSNNGTYPYKCTIQQFLSLKITGHVSTSL